ncbi:hypothetical protein BJ508DRAFT_113195 [Ascobolus immersus RN42]|uniref:F-box domain-containing protein n=1 Tax=Ascobolus immersus RN42 TaxID=1160509 RepID=A0A3N4I764_ASCIM|nr:hypothetical protein BJ508DRAFT_113195 [Ascobolus immersus RN42]
MSRSTFDNRQVCTDTAPALLTTSSPFKRLPNELLLEIISQIPDPRSFLSLSRVNKHFHSIITNDFIQDRYVNHWFFTHFGPYRIESPTANQDPPYPPIIEFIVRYVHFHCFAPFRCTDHPSHSNAPTTANPKVRSGILFKLWDGKWPARERLAKTRGAPWWGVVAQVDKNTGTTGEVGSLLVGYTTLPMNGWMWFPRFYRRLQQRGVQFVEDNEGVRDLHMLKLGVEDAVLAFHLVEGWRLRGGTGVTDLSTSQFVGEWTRGFYDEGWYWKRYGFGKDRKRPAYYAFGREDYIRCECRLPAKK